MNGGKNKSGQESSHDQYGEEESDPRPKIYLAIFSVVLGFGFLESIMIKVRKNKAAQIASQNDNQSHTPENLNHEPQTEGAPQSLVQAKMQIMHLEIEKLKLELELTKLKREGAPP